MIKYGKCCSPIPGDAIVGLISEGDVASIHRTDCQNTGHYSHIPEKFLKVSWNTDSEELFTVRLKIQSIDRKFLLSDISQSLGESGCNIQSAATETIEKIAKQDFWIDVKNITHLTSAITRLLKIDGVKKVDRYDESEGPIG